MYLLRRTAFRALTKGSPFAVKPRAISAAAPVISRIQQQWAISSLQRRSYSDEAPKPANTISDELQSTQAAAEAAPAPAATTETQASQDSLAASADPSTVYVGNLFFEVTEEQLRNVFSGFGALSSVTIVYDARGLSRGFAFVKFNNPEDAQASIDALHQQPFEGRRLVVQMNVAKSKPKRDLAVPLHQNPPSKTLFIGNMSFDMSDKDLNDLFRDIQNVLDVRVAIDRRTGQARGFAHADFINVESATKAKSILAGKQVYGRTLRVDFSKTNERRGRPERSAEEN